MPSLDYESKLDEALSYLAKGTVDDARRSMPDAAELIEVAQSLRRLQAAPVPRLAQGRERLLSEAAHRRDSARAWPSLFRQLFRRFSFCHDLV